jgi:hypothetical protein
VELYFYSPISLQGVARDNFAFYTSTIHRIYSWYIPHIKQTMTIMQQNRNAFGLYWSQEVTRVFAYNIHKGKVVPLQTRCGPEGSRRFRLPDFHDIRHMKVVRSSASRTGRLYPQECSWYSFSLEAESTPGPWCGRKENMSLKNPVTPPGIDPGTVRLVAQRLNH